MSTAAVTAAGWYPLARPGDIEHISLDTGTIPGIRPDPAGEHNLMDDPEIAIRGSHHHDGGDLPAPEAAACPCPGDQAAGHPPAAAPARIYERGDRVALEHTSDQHTRLRPGDEGTVTRYGPGLAQLDVAWDSGSTLSMLLDEGDRVRLITPGTAETGMEPGQ